MSDFATRLKELRNERKITQQELADFLHVSQNAIYNWENRKREPNLEIISKVAEYFEVTPSYLLGYMDTRHIIPVKLKNNLIEDPKNNTIIKTTNRRLEALAISFSKLNTSGQEKAVAQIDMLTKIPEYQKEPPEPPQE